ncbi:Acetyl-CoA carboxylase [Porphyridium purpureum]|uniref:Acetyl-CoA carboxylase n=1 Tax=Porphyridium purpureum TaxID=35688 RepID=A0A5J4YYN4_PORPP|nr:Acetyl-CoA carboxylase [Porphyridium purpureum]|eukprot:POR0506..scf209_3
MAAEQHDVNGSLARNDSMEKRPSLQLPGLVPPFGSSPRHTVSVDALPAGGRRALRARSVLKDYVDKMGGTRVLQRLLVANNGIAAVKCIRSIRTWVYETLGDERLIEFVVMATPEDIAANAEYVRMADHMVPVPGGSNKNNYANVRLITEIAVEYHCDGVWAGWGHASENPQLPRSLHALGLTFLGPGPEAMYALGDKVASTIIAQSAGVPCTAWSGDGITVKYADEGCVPDAIFRSACVFSAEEAQACANRIGYPVMIKASEGGGGKGIRMVATPDAITGAFRQVAGEVAGSPIFVMKVLHGARHLEVQLVADEHGNAIALWGRDCSVQRRHQKIIEEGPPIAADPVHWRHLEDAAVRLAKEVGYVGAGTVEYLYIERPKPGDPQFTFLELNPRLQVEHPVTEWITGVNIPALQLTVAMGIPLGAIRSIQRLFGAANADELPDGHVVDVSDLGKRLAPLGHVIACRITAENALAGFQPTSGAIRELTFRTSPNVWGYFSVVSQSSIHEFADSQFGHLFAFGKTRDAARRSMVIALKEISIRGDIHNTVEYLITLLERQDYRDNQFDTTWLDRLIKEKIAPEKPSSSLAVIAGAVCRAHADFEKRKALFVSSLDRGQLPSLDDTLVEFYVELILEDTKYRLCVTRTAPDALAVDLSGVRVDVEYHPLVDSGILIIVGGRSHVVYAHEDNTGFRMSLDGKSCLFEKEYDPTRLVSAVNGKLVRFLALDGQPVAKGAPYAELEVMKMYLTLTAPESGRVHHRKAEGSSIATGELVAELELDDPNMVKRAVAFTGEVDPEIQHLLKVRSAACKEPHKRFKQLLEHVNLLMSGFQRDEVCLDELLSILDEPSVVVTVLQDSLAALVGRLPRSLYELLEEELRGELGHYVGGNKASKNPSVSVKSSSLTMTADANGDLGSDSQYHDELERDAWQTASQSDRLHSETSRLLQVMDTFVETKVVRSERDSIMECLLPVRTVLSRYAAMESVGPVVVCALLEKFLYTEKPFSSSKRSQDVLFDMRDTYRSELGKVVDLAVSHMQAARKSALVLRMLDYLEEHETALNYTPLKACLHELSQFSAAKKAYGDVPLRARLMLANASKPRFRKRWQDLRASILEIIAQTEDGSLGELDQNAMHHVRADALRALVESQNPLQDVLVGLMLEPNTPYLPISMSSHRRNASMLSLSNSGNVGNGYGGSSPYMGVGANQNQSQTRLVHPDASPARTLDTSALDQSQPRLPSETLEAVRRIATELHVMRAFRAYELYDLMVESRSQGIICATWRFHYSQSKYGARLQSLGLTTALGGLGLGGSGGLDKASVFVTSHDSADNLAGQDSKLAFRAGVLAVFPHWDVMVQCLNSLLEQNIAEESDITATAHASVNVMTVVVPFSFANTHTSEVQAHSEGQISDAVQKFLRADSPQRQALFLKSGIKMVTFIVESRSHSGSVYPGFYTFRVQQDFQEDMIYRHIDQSMAFQLELSRLAHFDITRFEYPNRSINVFFAQSKKAKKPSLAKSSETNAADGAGAASAPGAAIPSAPGTAASATSVSGNARDTDARFFVRAVIRQADIFSSPSEVVVAIPEAERAFSEALDALEVGRFDRRFQRTDFNHIFLNLIPVLNIDVEDVEAICRRIFFRYASRCWKLRVFAVELRVVARKSTTLQTVPLRFLLFNPTGHMLRVEGYMEQPDAVTGMLRLSNIDRDNPGHMHGVPVLEPYKPMDRLQRNQVMAQSMETTYLYDFEHLFVKELQDRWRKYSQSRLLGGFRRHKIPLRLLDVVELVLDDDKQEQLVETRRAPGLNTIGMVAWRYTMYTPEYPSGRQVIVIANDITHLSGSFGPQEDMLFKRASELARKEKIPRVFLATNSGARIGLSEEVRRKFKVDWVDVKEPSKGFHGLYLDAEDASKMSQSGSVVLEEQQLQNQQLRQDVAEEGLETDHRSTENGKKTKISCIIGSESGLGVENLMGSGLIAGETSDAYESTFTLTYVTARSVGIGAYLVRLGQRVIQKESGAPIILTGHAALNKVLGREVYVTNEQLGGVKVMYPNGVSHLLVKDDIQGVGAILDWLSYVPRKRGERLPVTDSMDPINRPIQTAPSSSPSDPRDMLAGHVVSSGDDQNRDGFLLGFFDRGSWCETLGGWAKTVVTGRARLGGIPCGVIAVETRTVEKIVPADPASPETRESVSVQAGQVWYPDSAQKTAQTIRDFGGEELPLFIFANWRGFSGGMRDMFDEVLKAGSLIVDALRVYKQPIFIYIPPHGELRGGAWVVVDTQINPHHIEMYADPSSRGGVLEPEGTVEVKYRRRDLIKTMHRLDPELRRLDERLTGVSQHNVSESSGMLVLDEEKKRAIQDAISAREILLLPVYKQIAISFADLHDTPGRMLAMRAIRRVVPWAQARDFFYWRLQRRLAEYRIEAQCLDANPTLSLSDVRALMRRWAEMAEEVEDYEDDRAVFEWIEDSEEAMNKRVEKLRQEYIANQTCNLGQTSVDGFLDGVEELLRSMDKSQRQYFIRSLQDRVSNAETPGRARSGFLSHFRWDRNPTTASNSSTVTAMGATAASTASPAKLSEKEKPQSVPPNLPLE